MTVGNPTISRRQSAENVPRTGNRKQPAPHSHNSALAQAPPTATAAFYRKRFDNNTTKGPAEEKGRAVGATPEHGLISTARRADGRWAPGSTAGFPPTALGGHTTPPGWARRSRTARRQPPLHSQTRFLRAGPTGTWHMAHGTPAGPGGPSDPAGDQLTRGPAVHGMWNSAYE